MKTTEIKKINNGFLLTSYSGEFGDKSLIFYFKDWTDIINHLNSVYGAIEKELNKIREEKTQSV